MSPPLCLLYVGLDELFYLFCHHHYHHHNDDDDDDDDDDDRHHHYHHDHHPANTQVANTSSVSLLWPSS